MDEKMNPVRGEVLSPEAAMGLAIRKARRGLPFVSPNPAVGCVVLDAEGRFLSAGHHEKYGAAHAEVNAFRGLSPDELRQAQVFVTLEPCAHEGKTPSCAKMLARFPVAKVIYGLVDPNPLVCGQGAQILREAGIAAELYRDKHGEGLETELEESCEAFLWNFRRGSPFVSLKVAASLDGRVALADGSSRWITGPLARERGHELRANHDAILIGAGTLLRDDPSLDVRHPLFSKRNKAVVLDTDGRHLSGDWKVLASHGPAEVLWVLAEDRSEASCESSRMTVLTAERNTDGPGLNPRSVLDALWIAGIRSVLIEGGARVAGAFLKAGLVNRLHLFQAPVLLGGDARSWTEGFSLECMEDRPFLAGMRFESLGLDLHLTGLLRDPRSGAIRRAV